MISGRLLSPFLGGLFLGLVLAASSLAHEADLVRGVIGGDPTVERVSYEQVIKDALIERNACWTGEPPADMQGKVPGAVVMAYRGQPARLFHDVRYVSIALDHLFTGSDPRVDAVWAFCR